MEQLLGLGDPHTRPLHPRCALRHELPMARGTAPWPLPAHPTREGVPGTCWWHPRPARTLGVGWFQAALVEVCEREHPKRAAAPLAAACLRSVHLGSRGCDHASTSWGTRQPPRHSAFPPHQTRVWQDEKCLSTPQAVWAGTGGSLCRRGGPKGAPRYRPALAPVHPTCVRGDGDCSHREQ